MADESSHYDVVERLGAVEIRDYEAYLAAETVVPGPPDRAGNAGFRTLARFIFGANRTDSGASTKIAMTTPVAQEPMGDRFRIRFMMPSEYTESTLPVPTDDRVTIRRIDPQLVAAIRYRGTWSTRSYDRQLAELRQTLDAAGRRTIGDPVWARYDPPWTPWFLRRNEVLIELARPDEP